MNLTCENCGVAFETRNKRRSCSRSCAVALSWKDPEKAAKRRASVTAARRSPESRAASTAANYWRWCQPGAREKMAEQSRKRWAKSRMRKKMSKAIRAAQGTPEQRAFYSDMRKLDWQNPDYRAAVVAGMRRHHQSPEARGKFRDLLTERWNDPEMRAKYEAGIRRFTQTPEYRAKLSSKMRERWANDECYRSTVIEAMRLYNSSDGAREFRSARMKALWADPVWKMRQLTLIAGGMAQLGTPLAAAAAAAAAAAQLNGATDLIAAVDRVVPRGLPDFMRADVCQDLLVALFEGALKLHELEKQAKRFLTEHRKMFPDMWGPISIDAPIPGTDGLTIADTLSNETPHF